jgi:hypothetical protein
LHQDHWDLKELNNLHDFLHVAMIFNRRKIALHYLRTGFFMDAISTIPWGVMVSSMLPTTSAVIQIVRSDTTIALSAAHEMCCPVAALCSADE